MRKTFIISMLVLWCITAKTQVQVNTYSQSRVSAKGFYGRSDLSKEVIIPGINADQVVAKWKIQGVKKFAEPVQVDISPFQQGIWEANDRYMVNRIKITAANARSVTIYFDKLSLSKNAELFIYNADGTIVTGPITEKENISGNNGKLWASNVFPGSSVIIEFRAPAREQKLNVIHVKKILYGIRPEMKQSNSDSTKQSSGYGSSSGCNDNAVCLGSGWDLERRAVALTTHEGGIQCTGALVMNACGTTRPFLLTANHCIVSGGGTVNTANSTFLFLWMSPNCTPTSNTTSTLLFNGATIRARWANSDFALLELDDAIPRNSNITFLGWSRSTTAPSSTVGISHPLGDIMKASVDNDATVVGNIGTFTNNAWRVQWDDGTVQDGSSGSPLFDQADQRLRGQLYSNTQPETAPCNRTTGGSNYGRFDVSWGGGGNSTDRLSNWLDPLNSNPSTTNTTDVSNLLPHDQSLLTISGNTNFCSGTSGYTLNVPTGTTITWASSNENVATVSGGTVTKVMDGITTISASITVCGSTFTATKDIYIGVPTIDLITFANGADDGQYFCTSHVGNQFDVLLGFPPASGSIQYRLLSWPGLSVVYTDPTSYAIGSPISVGSSYSTGYYVLEARLTTDCGTGDWTGFEVEFVNCSMLRSNCVECGFSLTASPNPTSGDLTVTIGKEKTGVKALSKNERVRYMLYNFNQTRVVKEWTFDNTQNQRTLNVAGVKAGQYVLVVIKGKYRQSAQIIIQ
jgi:lysyl endopeptidase